ncbi:flagellar protein FlaG [Mesobacillus sp.]|uniref:flagellar protein FlaG n=1 Tax=Mesobacillus sp. TaxID=2675271 RepID=UPI0039F0C02F
MIERISSNQLSSQLRSIEKIDVTAEKQENVLQAENKDEINESLNFPKEKVKEIVDGMNKFMEASPTALKFEFHEKLNEYYVKIVDEITKQTVREIPPKKMLDYYAAMTEFIGLMVDKKI